MDRRERVNSLGVAVRAMMDGRQADIWTALPAKVVSFEAATNTCHLQPTVQAQALSQKGIWENITLPILPDVPVFLYGGGIYVLTVPVAAGDEGLVVFSSRCIDGWFDRGDVAQQTDLRMHDLSDGFFLPGFRSQPRVVENVSTNAIQIRTLDGGLYFEIGPEGLLFNGNIKVRGDIISVEDELDTAPISLRYHTHPKV